MADSLAGTVASLVAIAFSFSTFERFLARRRRYDLAWSVALALFAVASAALALGASAAGWNSVSFRVFFLFGAILNVPFLALGSVYLLAGRRVGDVFAVVVLVGSGYAIGVVATAPLRAPIPRHVLAQGAQVFPSLLPLLAGIASGAGTAVIVLGALYSLWRRPGRRFVVANVLIALGTLVTGASGVANSVFDKMTAFAVALGLGIVVIFVGFLFAQLGPSETGRAGRTELSRPR